MLDWKLIHRIRRSCWTASAAGTFAAQQMLPIVECKSSGLSRNEEDIKDAIVKLTTNSETEISLK